MNDTAKKTKKEEEREQNRKDIYHLIRNNDYTSKKEIANTLQLSLPTINFHIQSLLDDGLIFANGYFQRTGGRKAQTYSAVLQKKTAFGIEIAPDHISIVVLDLRGDIIDSLHIRQDYSRDEWYLQNLSSLLQELKDKNHLDDTQILGVGIVIPGLVSKDFQAIEVCPILGITGTTAEYFARYIPYPITLHNDANAACFSETWENPNIDNCFFIMVGDYIGGSVVIDKNVYKGENYRSGEIGHTTLIPNGLPCYCGKKGCFDAYCSTKNLTRYSNGSLNEFFAHLKLKNQPYTDIWKHYLENFAIGLNNIRMLFNSPIIIGGPLGTYIEDHLDELKAIMLERNSFDTNADFLHSCRFRHETFASGGALTYIAAFLRDI